MTDETTDTDADGGVQDSMTIVEKANEAVMGARMYVEDVDRDEFIQQNKELLRNPPTVPVWLGLILTTVMVVMGASTLYLYSVGEVTAAGAVAGGTVGLLGLLDLARFVYEVLRA